MNELQIKAVLAGVFFGVWPLIMNRSGLSGNVSSACFSTVVLATVLPFALASSGFSLPTTNWVIVISAGLLGASGLLLFNSMLAGASLEQVGTLLVVVTTVQVVIAATHKVIVSGQLSIEKIVGYIAAGVATYFLLRK